MPVRVSAGLVPYRIRNGRLEILLAHPGGPLHAQDDAGCWSIPKGEVERHETMLQTAIRETHEEVGLAMPATAHYIELGSIRQQGGKIVHAWGIECADLEPDLNNVATFQLEWPPNSGQFQSFPEVDHAQFMSLSEAQCKIKPTQIPLLERLVQSLKVTE